MASVAYRPEQTQTPYLGWTPSARGNVLQVDAFVLDWGAELTLALDNLLADVPGLRVVPLPDREAFKAQYEQWLKDSLFDSLPERMTRHASYKAIVAQGERIVPLIAAELRKEPSFLFLALEDITGADPVPPEVRGNLKATVAAWLTWLRK